MDRLSGIGRFLFAAGIAGFAAQALVSAAPVPGLEPLSPSVPGRMLLANATGVLLLVAAGGMLAQRSRRWAGIGLAGLMGLWLLALHAPALIEDPSDVAGWSHAFMTLGVGAAALALAGVDGGPAHPGRRLFGLSLLAFGLIHLLCHQAIAGMVPAWIPARSLWPWLTGSAQVAAGLALLSGLLARPAAALTGLMFAAWIVLLHIPAVAAAPTDGGEWNRLFVALALSGGAWIVSRRA
jgi:uncharacterized membrane protein YphA (DoxX/SURF4 family)